MLWIQRKFNILKNFCHYWTLKNKIFFRKCEVSVSQFRSYLPIHLKFCVYICLFCGYLLQKEFLTNFVFKFRWIFLDIEKITIIASNFFTEVIGLLNVHMACKYSYLTAKTLGLEQSLSIWLRSPFDPKNISGAVYEFYYSILDPEMFWMPSASCS